MTNNDIGSRGATVLADALKYNNTLTRLNLCLNGIGDAGAESLAEALKTNTALTELDLEETDIGDAGATALALVLGSTYYSSEIGEEKSWKKLKRMSNVQIKKNNRTLTRLVLTGNRIGARGETALAEALKTNEKIRIKF